MRHSADLQKIKDIKHRKQKAYEDVICQNYETIYSLMVYLTKNNTALAEDLTQETFVSAWDKIDTYKANASLKTWLYRIAYNKFIDMKRKLNRQSRLLDNLKENNRHSTDNSNPFQQFFINESSRILIQAVHKLDSSDYFMIVLHYIQNLTYRDMARVLDKPVGTVKSQTSKALKKLRASLNGRL